MSLMVFMYKKTHTTMIDYEDCNANVGEELKKLCTHVEKNTKQIDKMNNFILLHLILHNILIHENVDNENESVDNNVDNDCDYVDNNTNDNMIDYNLIDYNYSSQIIKLLVQFFILFKRWLLKFYKKT